MSGFGILARPGLKPWPTFEQEGRPPIQRPPEGAQAVRDATTVRDPHHVAWVNEFSSAVNNGSSSIVLPEADGIRNILMLRNASATANIYISFGRQASTLSPLVLAPGDVVLFDTVCPQNDVNAYGDAASAVLCGAVAQYAV